MIKNLGKTIESLRKNQGYSLNEFANLVGVTIKTLAKWEQNKSHPRVINVIKLCEVLKISVHFLLNYDKQ